LRSRRFLLIAASLAGLSGCAGEGTGQAPAVATEEEVLAPKVTHFYAVGEEVEAGKEVTVCYGVENAETVRIDPEVEKLWPSINRCISIAPARSGSYRLTAAGPGGEDSEELAIKVVAPRPPAGSEKRDTSLIATFLSSSESVSPGAAVTLCYVVGEVDSLTLEPPLKKLEPMNRCIAVRIDSTTTFKLSATAGERNEQRTLTVTVK
jgi:hypothetical protein